MWSTSMFDNAVFTVSNSLSTTSFSSKNTKFFFYFGSAELNANQQQSGVGNVAKTVPQATAQMVHV